MNDTMRNRLIGLAVILVILFLLSWLIPRQPKAPSGESIPVAAVPVGAASTAVATVASAPDVTPVGEAASASTGDDGIRTQPYSANDNAQTAAQAQSAAPAGRPGARVDVSSAPAVPTPAQAAASDTPVKHEPAPDKAAAASAAFVQIGSYSDAGNAQSVLSELRKKGYRADVDQVTVGGKSFHRVRVGPYSNRDAAGAAQKKLAAEGYKGSTVVGGS